MARIRTLKPEFWTDEKLALMVPVTRLVFLGLISQADDNGRLVDNVKLLDGMLFPFTDDSCDDSLADLANLGRIIRYRSESGQALIQVANWDRHQKVKNPSQYTLPAPSTTKTVESTPKLVETPPSDPLSPIPDLQTPTADPHDWRQHRAACVEFLRSKGYGPSERLIAEGEDTQIWRLTKTGTPVPWDDRLRILLLAHARVEGGESPNLRHAMKWAVPQQYNPHAPRTSEPKPNTEHAAVRSENPKQNHSASTGGLKLVGAVEKPPEKPVVDFDAERVSRWEAEHPELAERTRTLIAARIARGESPKGAMAQRAWADAEFRKIVLERIREEAAA